MHVPPPKKTSSCLCAFLFPLSVHYHCMFLCILEFLSCLPTNFVQCCSLPKKISCSTVITRIFTCYGLSSIACDKFILFTIQTVSALIFTHLCCLLCIFFACVGKFYVFTWCILVGSTCWIYIHFKIKFQVECFWGWRSPFHLVSLFSESYYCYDVIIVFIFEVLVWTCPFSVRVFPYLSSWTFRWDAATN